MLISGLARSGRPVLICPDSQHTPAFLPDCIRDAGVCLSSVSMGKPSRQQVAPQAGAQTPQAFMLPYDINSDLLKAYALQNTIEINVQGCRTLASPKKSRQHPPVCGAPHQAGQKREAEAQHAAQMTLHNFKCVLCLAKKLLECDGLARLRTQDMRCCPRGGCRPVWL